MLYEFPTCASGKEPTCQCRRPKKCMFRPWVRPPGGGHGNPPQCSCLEDPMDRGAWRAAVHGVPELDVTEVTGHIRTVLYSVSSRLILYSYFVPVNPLTQCCPSPFLLPTGNSSFVFYACESASFLLYSLVCCIF